MNKQKLRKEVLSKIKAMSVNHRAEQSRVLSLKLVELCKDYRSIGCYEPFSTEVDIREAIRHWQSQQRVVAFPDNISMNYRDAHGLQVDPQIVIVPGRAFDVQRNRLGRGKGCYDKWILGHPGIPTIGVAFDVQMYQKIPTEDHDQRLTFVITPNKTYQSGLHVVSQRADGQSLRIKRISRACMW